LDGYLSDYECFFRSKTKKFFEMAVCYAHGLFRSDDRNIERICVDDGRLCYHRMQHFISDSPWDWRGVMDRVAADVDASVPRNALVGLLVDETGVCKKGDGSVGVGWQYCGNAGKVCNSQVSVLGVLCGGDHAAVVDARLYLPGDWSDDPERCARAGIPEGVRGHRSKTDIAFELISHQLELGTAFDFVSADGLYGHDTELGSRLSGLGVTYMLDIHSNQAVYPVGTALEVPQGNGTRGRKPTKLQPTEKGVRVDRYREGLDSKDWEWINTRGGSKGKLGAYYHFTGVCVWNPGRQAMEERTLVIRRRKTRAGWETKYSLTNAGQRGYSHGDMAFMQGQRFFVEHSIKEAKSVVGMDQFQTRKWLAWHHQMALNMMAGCFIMKEKLTCFDELPLLSAWDIKRWIQFRVSRQLTEDDLIERMFKRHYKRQKDINIAYNKQNRQNGNVSK